MCLEVLHWTGDQLCRDPKFGKLERPRLPPPALGAPAPAGPADVTERLAGEVQQVNIYSNVVNVFVNTSVIISPEPKVLELNTNCCIKISTKNVQRIEKI